MARTGISCRNSFWVHAPLSQLAIFVNIRYFWKKRKFATYQYPRCQTEVCLLCPSSATHLNRGNLILIFFGGGSEYIPVIGKSSYRFVLASKNSVPLMITRWAGRLTPQANVDVDTRIWIKLRANNSSTITYIVVYEWVLLGVSVWGGAYLVIIGKTGVMQAHTKGEGVAQVGVFNLKGRRECEGETAWLEDSEIPFAGWVPKLIRPYAKIDAAFHWLRPIQSNPKLSDASVDERTQIRVPMFHYVRR